MSIIKDGKVYRTLEEQVYYLTREFKEVKEAADTIDAKIAGKQDKLTFDEVPTDGSTNPVESNGIYDVLETKQNTLTFDDTPTASSNNPVKSGGVYNVLQDKQDKLTSASLTEGTLDKAVGFDSLGNLIKGVASGGGGTDDYDDLENKPITNQTKVSSYGAFSVGDVIDKIHFDTTKSSELTSFLENLTYTQGDGNIEYLIAGNSVVIAAYNLSAMSLGYVIIELDTGTIFYGTQSGNIGDVSWNAGYNNLDLNGNYTFESDEIASLSSAAGWNGTLISEFSEDYLPHIGLNEFAHRVGTIGQNTIHGFKKVLVEDSITYADSISENQTDAVQGGAIYTALSGKQDKISQSSVDYGTANEMLALDGNGDLVRANLPSSGNLYRHNIQLNIGAGSGYANLQLILNHNNQISQLVTLISTIAGQGRTPAFGSWSINSKKVYITAISRNNGSSINIFGYYLDGSDSSEHSASNSAVSIIADTISQIM